MQHYECTNCHSRIKLEEPSQVSCSACGGSYLEWLSYPSYAGESTLELVKYPATVLNLKCLPVRDGEFGSQLETFCLHMINVMRTYHGIGLAANQVGDSRRIVVMKRDDKYMSLINPEIIGSSDLELVKGQEGCLSFPGVMESIDRVKSVTVSYQTTFGLTKVEEFQGIDSVCIQHEIDHLNGQTFLDRMSRLKKQIILKKMSKRK